VVNKTARHILRDARRAAGLSQRQLAALAGVPHSTVARIEALLTSPRVDTLERLLRAAGHALTSEPVPRADRTVIRALLEVTPTERVNLGTANSPQFRAFERAARHRAGLPELGIPRSMDIDELEQLKAVREELDSRRG
jgi:transcriptional regulator with XRE-family HTH domain